MKKTIITTAFSFIAAFSFCQEKKQDSMILQIQMDTATFKNCVQLIQENINSQTATGKVLLQNILVPFYQNLKLVPREAIKPKEEKKK